MYDAEVNKHRLCIRDNLLNCSQPHQHIHLKGKKQVLQCTNSKMVFVDNLIKFFMIHIIYGSLCLILK